MDVQVIFFDFLKCRKAKGRKRCRMPCFEKRLMVERRLRGNVRVC